MGDAINLQQTSLLENRELIVDLCRFAENVLTEAQVKKRYAKLKLDWDRLGDDDELCRAIEDESLRRVRDGPAKREKSQLLVMKAPEVASSIMLSSSANDRHRLDAAKTLNDFAANGPDAAVAAERFVIHIDLGGDSLRFDKSIKPDPHDVDPNNTLQSRIAAIAKLTDGDGDEHL